MSRRVNKRSALRTRRRGMTLIELVIVSAILATVLVAILSFVNQGAVKLQAIQTIVRDGHEGPVVLQVIERDFMNAYVDERMEHFFEADGGVGDSEVRFVTSRNSTLYLNNTRADITEVGYKIVPNRDEATERSNEVFTLMRREDYLLDKEPLDGGLWIPLADNVLEFKLTYYDLPEDEDGEGISLSEFSLGSSTELEEKESWDKEDRYLPYAVKIVLVLDIREGADRANPDKEEEGRQSFTTLIRLPPFARNLEHVEDEEDTLNLRVLPVPTENPDPNGGDNNATPNTNN